MARDDIQLYLFFDRRCPLCCRFKEAIERWDAAGAIAVVDVVDPETAERFPQVDLEWARRELTVLEPADGATFQGGEALQRLTRLLPGIRRLAWAYRLPGVTPVVGQLYRAVNRRRKRLCLHCGEKWMPSMKYSRRKRGR